MSHLFTHPTMRHPLTGARISALAVHPRTGLPVWPIMGGDNTNPPIPEQPPEGVSEEEWTALGDPGKRAIVRERERAETAERELTAARQRPTPPKPADPPKPTEPKPGETPDIAALIQQAVSEAVAPFQQAEEQRRTEEAANKVRQAVLDVAAGVLHDPTDALANVDLTSVIDDKGVADPTKVKAALENVVNRKPHLAKSTLRQAPAGIGGGAPAGATDAEKVKAVLADMQRATGLRSAAAGTN